MSMPGSDGADSTTGEVIRPLRADEDALLAEATLMNVNWTGEQRLTAADVAAEPSLAHYTVLHRGRGDEALVAVGHGAGPDDAAPGAVVGLVWYLFLDADDPGYGYVADGVPELSVCVWPGHRGQGLGARLVEAACAHAAARGIRRMSLSVESGNPARRLYERLGFVDVPGAAEGTIVRDLAADRVV